MKRTITIILIVTAFFLMACGSGSTPPPTPPPINNTPAPAPTPDPAPAPPPPVVNTPDPAPDPMVFSLMVYNSSEAGFSNGTVYHAWKTGQVMAVGNGLIAVDDIMYAVNSLGNVVSETQLPAIPSAVVISGADIWTFETIPPDYAAANGGLSKEYTRVWLNYAEQGAWLDRQYTATRAITTLSGDVIAYDTLDRPYNITGSEAPHYASDGGIFVHTVDATTRTGKIMTDTGNYAIAWSTNYFNSADQWLEIEGAWYSWNGYVWNSTDGLSENASAMTAFIAGPLYPYILEAGTRVGASLERGYWIEATTGWLWRYTPAMNKLEQVARLYILDVTRAEGAVIARDMDPRIITVEGKDTLFYGYEGYLWRYEFDSGINGPFMAGRKVRGL